MSSIPSRTALSASGRNSDRVRLTERIALIQAEDADLEDLLAVRISAMRESLERIGRFDLSRA